jgi:hypothetical protein
MTIHIHRVIVRGFFDRLDDRQLAALRDAQADHDILRSGFTHDGTLTYEPNITAFSFRFEVRTTDEDGHDHHDAAMQIGIGRAEATLEEMGVGYKRLRATAADMADVWRED